MYIYLSLSPLAVNHSLTISLPLIHLAQHCDGESGEEARCCARLSGLRHHGGRAEDHRLRAEALPGRGKIVAVVVVLLSALYFTANLFLLSHVLHCVVLLSPLLSV